MDPDPDSLEMLDPGPYPQHGGYRFGGCLVDTGTSTYGTGTLDPLPLGALVSFGFKAHVQKG